MDPSLYNKLKLHLSTPGDVPTVKKDEEKDSDLRQQKYDSLKQHLLGAERAVAETEKDPSLMEQLSYSVRKGYEKFNDMNHLQRIMDTYMDADEVAPEEEPNGVIGRVKQQAKEFFVKPFDVADRYQMNDKEVAEFNQMNRGQKREFLKYKQEQNLREDHPSINEDELNPLAKWVGGAAGALASPTTMIPFGGGYKAAAIGGGALAAWDSTVYQLAEEGKIDKSDVAWATVIGAVAAPLFLAGGKKFGAWLQNRKAMNAKVTGDDLDDFIKQHKIDPSDVNDGDLPGLAKDINRKIGISEQLDLPLEDPAQLQFQFELKGKQLGEQMELFDSNPEFDTFFHKFSKAERPNISAGHAVMHQKERDAVAQHLKADKARSGWTGQHERKESMAAREFGEWMQLKGDELEDFVLANELHDTGKQVISKELLNAPRPLTASERKVMSKHAAAGAKLIDDVPGEVGRLGRQITKGHHTPPAELAKKVAAGEMTVVDAQKIKMSTIADAFEALTSKQRPYPKTNPVTGRIVPPPTRAQAVELMMKDNRFDETLLGQFARMQLNKYPHDFTKAQTKAVQRFLEKGMPPPKVIKVKPGYVERPGYAWAKITEDEVGQGLKIAAKDARVAVPARFGTGMTSTSPQELRNKAIANESHGEATVETGQFMDVVRRHKEAGSISPQLLAQIGSSTTGAGLGYAWGGPEGVLAGAILGGSLPWVGGKVYKALGKHGAPHPQGMQPHVQMFSLGDTAMGRPNDVIRKFGRVGQIMAEGLSRGQENYRRIVASKVINSEKMLRNSGINGNHKLEAQFIAGMQRAVPDTALDKRVLGAVQTTRKEFNQVLNDAVSSGVMSAKQANILRQEALTQGYWPRVWNENYLHTKEGHDQFIDIMTKQQWNPKSLEDTLKAVLGEDQKAISHYTTLVGQTSNYTMTRDVAEALFRSRGATLRIRRSGHLEHARKVNVISEAILRPFLYQKPLVVLQQYMDDAYKRIEMSKIFGAHDEILDNMAADINLNYGTSASDYARKTFYTVVGDSRSPIIKQQVEWDNYGVWSKFNDRIDALQTHKLARAQIINMGQATINGLMLLAARGAKNDVISPFKFVAKGWKDAMTTSGREFARRSGAVYETTVMEYMAELSKVNHSVLGRELKGVLSPLEVLNNPAKFLKFTQFTRVEEFQRILAANTGKAFFEDLLERKSALMSQGKLSKAAQNKLDDINKQLDDFGIDSTITPTRVPESQMLNAVQRFSNDINHINSADRLPLWAQSPHVKMFRKFKTFMYHQGQFLKTNVMKPAREGNFAPLMMLLGVGTPVGMGLDEFRRMIVGDDRELSMTERVVRGSMSVGAAGIMLDVAISSSRTPTQLGQNIAGPAIGDLGKLVYGAGQSIKKQDPEPFAKSIAKMESSILRLISEGAAVLDPDAEKLNQWLRGEQQKKAKVYRKDYLKNE